MEPDFTDGQEPDPRAAESEPTALDDFYESIRTWARAYPTDIFHVPTRDGWKRLHEAAQAAGLNGIDAFSADSMRHVITKVCAYMEAAIERAKLSQESAWVPIHPKHGPLWSMTTSEPNPDRLPSYPLRALMFADAALRPSEGPAEASRVLAEPAGAREHVAGDDCWCDPTVEFVAETDAEYILEMVDAYEAHMPMTDGAVKAHVVRMRKIAAALQEPSAQEPDFTDGQEPEPRAAESEPTEHPWRCFHCGVGAPAASLDAPEVLRQRLGLRASEILERWETDDDYGVEHVLRDFAAALATRKPKSSPAPACATPRR